MLDCFRIGSIDPLAGGTEIMFMAIASSVIGGTLLTGGSGTIIGAFLGAVVLGLLKDGFTLSGVSAYTFDMILGGAILIYHAHQCAPEPFARGGRRGMSEEVLRTEHLSKSFGQVTAPRNQTLSWLRLS